MTNFFQGIFDNLNKIAATASGNIGFLLISIGIVALLIFTAYAAELWISKKTAAPLRQEKLKVKRMALIGILSAVAILLMLFKFPLWFAPGFYTMDFSEIPVVLGAFALGPVAGLTIEFIKILLNLLINGTSSAFVGEFANFLMGSAFVIPAASIYFYRKTKKRALIGLITGTLLSTSAAAVLNAYVLLPKYVELMHKDLSFFIDMGTEKNAAISNLSTFIFFAVIPFNLLKYALVSLIVALIYKYISRVIKEQQS